MQPLTMFKFAPLAYANDLKNQGYVHIKDGVTPEFFEFARSQAAQFQSKQSLPEWEIKEKKQQCLFEFPEDGQCFALMLETLAVLFGLDLGRMTIAERHIKFYDKNAPSHPAPHKDRLASQIAVGIPLEVCEESRLVLYPTRSRSINPFMSAITAQDGLDTENVLTGLILGSNCVAIDTRPGDVIVFHGSSLYHERLSAAGSVMLYFKFNDMRLDPIAEDPATLAQRQKSLEILLKKSDIELLDSRVEVSPRLHRVSRHYTRLYWKELLQAYIWGEREFVISESDLGIFIKIADGCTVRNLLVHLGLPEVHFTDHVPQIRRLGKLGGIDFLS